MSETKTKTQVFISYASEDALLAGALERAFFALKAADNSHLTVFLDVHSLKHGAHLTNDIQDELRKSDILFIIYTERLKLSHSFTGFEVGVFSNERQHDLEDRKRSDREIITLFLDEQAPLQQGVLGIKLNIAALDPANINGSVKLDPSDGLKAFFGRLSDILVRRKFEAMHPDGEYDPEALVSAKTAARVRVDSDIVPQLEKDIKIALSKLVERNQVEQQFLRLQWNGNTQTPTEEISDETLLIAEKESLFGIFGLDPHRSISWETFKAELGRVDPKGDAFVIDSIQSAVRSALAPKPVDNDQVFRSLSGQLYRIIVTRHYLYFDGSRSMHLYFIPFLTNRLLQPEVERALSLLRLSAYLRSAFLVEGSPYAPSAFDFYQAGQEDFNALAKSAITVFQVIAGGSHNVGLDDPRRFEQFFGRDKTMTNAEIGRLYADWKVEAEAFSAVSAAFATDGNAETGTAWRTALEKFLAFAEPINKRIGEKAASRFLNWFTTGKLDEENTGD